MRNLVLKNQVLFGTVNADASSFSSAVERLGRFMQRWPTTMRSLIAKRRPLDDAPKLLSDYEPAIKHVVNLGGV